MNPQEIIKNLLSRNIQSEVFQSETESSSIIFENDVFKKIESKSVSGTGLRVIKDQKIGFSYSSGNQLGKLVDFATENASLGNEAKFQFPDKPASEMDGLFHEEVQSLTFENMKQTGQEIVEKFHKELPGFQVNVDIEKEISQVKIANSTGLDTSYQKTYYSVFFSVMRAKDDEIFSAADGSVSLGIDNAFHHRAEELIGLCQRLDDRTQIRSGNYPVIFTPKAAALLYNILTFAFNGKNIQKGSSPLCGKMGEQLFASNFTMTDMPLYPGGISSQPFDGEGTPSKDKALIKNGRIENFIYDLFTASLLGEKSTGNGRRGYSTIPAPGFYNVHIQPGNSTVSDMISQIKEGIYVDEFIGGGQSNVIAGEFSVNLTLAYKIENGKITGSLKDTMISGNVFNLFKNNPVFGKDLYTKSIYITPYLQLQDVSVSA